MKLAKILCSTSYWPEHAGKCNNLPYMPLEYGDIVILFEEDGLEFLCFTKYGFGYMTKSPGCHCVII